MQISVDSRVMIDAAFFRKISPNCSRLKINEPADSITVIDLWDLSEPAADNDQGGSEGSLGQVGSHSIGVAEMSEDDFLICPPTLLSSTSCGVGFHPFNTEAAAKIIHELLLNFL
jgi:hypothetical protein